MELTTYERTMIEEFLTNEYCDGCLDDSPWSWSLTYNTARHLGINEHAGAAILGSLVKKGLMKQHGKGNDASCWLTEEGKNWIRENLPGKYNEPCKRTFSQI